MIFEETLIELVVLILLQIPFWIIAAGVWYIAWKMKK
jgi:hypothetical protein